LSVQTFGTATNELHEMFKLDTGNKDEV